LAIVSASSFAGIGGYSSTSCISKSGRTIVTMTSDDSGFNGIVNLIQDGQIAVYKASKDGVEMMETDKGHAVLKNDKVVLSLDGINENRQLTINVDTRIGTIADVNAKRVTQKVAVSCKSFTQEP
jgi:hypothetical protein